MAVRMADRIVKAAEWTPSETLRTEYLPRALALLREIASDPKKLEWCSGYTVYFPYEDTFGLDREFDWFIEASYQEGLVVKDYFDYVEHFAQKMYSSDPEWLHTLSMEELLSCIAVHFRRDHHSNGSLIEESVPSGAMLRLLEELQKRVPEDN